MKTDYRSPRTEDAAVGDIVQLRCIYSGYPEPQYTWFKDESEKITVGIFQNFLNENLLFFNCDIKMRLLDKFYYIKS